jgi:RNA polymerase sigma-70 factor (sigma-E family)
MDVVRLRDEAMTVARAREDTDAFCDFVASRSGALFRLAYLLLGDHQLAQDLVQESLARVYVAWPRLRDVANAEAYTRRVITTTAISWRRRRSFHERPAEVVREVAGRDQVSDLVVHEVLWAHLLELPPRQRAAIVLRHWMDLSEAQAAEAMGCSVGAVKSSTSAGLKRLRERIGPDLELRGSADEVVRP